MLFRKNSLERLQLNAFGYATWKSYDNLRKKAVEQEFTWGGFVISLSIAFLFVYSSSVGLNALYERAIERSSYNDDSSHILLIERIPDKTLDSSFIC